MMKNLFHKTGIACFFMICHTVMFAQGISFTTNTTSGCAPLTVVFTNTSTNPQAYRYEWNFNDGSPLLIDTMPGSVTHTYTGSGMPNPFLNVFSNTGSYLGYSYGNGTITVNGASINSADSACIGDQVNFCTSGNNIMSASWNFGDPSSGINNTSSQMCMSHAFSANGNYTVTLNANGPCGPQTITKTIYIRSNIFPHPYSQAYPNPACPGQPVTFGAGGYSTYSWNFNDPSSGASNTSTVQNPLHAFTGLGVFTPSLTVTNGCGNSGSTTTSVTIMNSPPFPNYPSFNLQASSPSCPNSNVQFNSPSGYNSYQWTFGDGSPLSTTSNYYNNHIYTAAGTYAASVKIISVCGNDTTLYRTVVISNTAPFPNYPSFQLLNSSPACPGSYVNFDAPGGFNSYEWHFGDGSPIQTTTNNNNYHLYGNTITDYNAYVIITNGCGNDTTLNNIVKIRSNVGFPNQSWFSINAGPNPACQSDQVSFNGPSGYNSYAWNFGDGNTASTSSNNTSHTYSAIGTYTTALTITNNCGNDTIIYASVVVNNTGSFPSWLQIDASPNVTCPNDIIEFRVNQGGFQTYAWNFGDGSTLSTTGERIQHAYTTAGTYTVTCTITNGCGLTTTVSGSIDVSNSSPVNPSLTISAVQNPSCPTDAVFFTVHSGQPTYTYIWNFGDGSAADTTIGSGVSHVFGSVGTYNVTAYVKNGCGSTLTASTTQVISNTAMPVLRDGNGSKLWGFPGSDHGGGGVNTTAGCVGDAVVFYFEGSAATNTWNFGDGNSGTATEQMLVYGGDGAVPVTIIRHAFSATGNYLITLTLTNGCGNTVTDTMTIHIGSGLPVDGDMTTSPPPFSTCAPVAFLAFGGANYAWNFGDGATLTTSSSSVSHTFATAGVYVVTVLVTNGCGNTATFSRSLNVTGVGGPAVTLSSAISPTCVSGSNGSATISVGSGQAPYSFAWNDPSGQTTATATGLAAGLYYATVTDNIGCSSTLAVNISDPAPIVPSIATTTTACGASTGTATASVSSGGSGSYNYVWSTGITTATATGLAAGTYSVTITDAVTGCTANATASISENGGATVSLNTVTNVTCNGSANGAININVTGGTAPYTYMWSNAAIVQDPSGLTAGNYSVTVTDNSGCHATLNATVTQPAAINVVTAVVTSPTCGNFDGQAKVSASGGTGAYTYLWDNNAGNQTTQTATGLPAGTYTVTVTDASGCSMPGTIDLSNSNAPNITAVVNNVSCYNGSNGAVDITVTGGTSPYLYTWNVGPPQTNHQDLNTLIPGNYIVFVNDAHGCMSFRSYNITQPALLTASVTNTGVTCGNVDGTATATPVGGNTSFTYAWTGGQTSQTATGLATGNYTVTVTDNKGCSATATTSLAATTIPQEICMVTVDAASTHNIIYWEKPVVTNIDSFRIYREDVTNVYTLIGAVPYDSLSEYHDYGANPNTTTKRYKISAVDNCGGVSALSNYHNTIYIVDNGLGQFTWNPLYTIEGGANPVSNYRLMRDDNSTGTWNQVAITAGTQNTLVDPAYATYTNGSWYVETLWGITCTPTRATVNTSRSNIKHALALGITSNPDLSAVNVYPNPASDNVTIELPALSGNTSIQIMNQVGQIVYEQRVNASANSGTVEHINTGGFAKGIYTIVIKSNNARAFKKLVLN